MASARLGARSNETSRAGASRATVAVVHRRRGLPRRKRRRKGGLGEIVASNSFLVDVHLIRRP